MFQHFCPYRAQAPRHIIPRVSLRLPWAEEVIGLSARLGLTGLCATIVFSARLTWLLTHVFGFCWFIIQLLLVHYPVFSESSSCFFHLIILLLPTAFSILPTVNLGPMSMRHVASATYSTHGSDDSPMSSEKH